MTPYTHHSELQLITALSLIYTLFISPSHTHYGSVFTGRILATDFNTVVITSLTVTTTHDVFFSQPDSFRAISSQTFDRRLQRLSIRILAESDSYVKTDGQSANLYWNKAPIWGLRPDFYYCQTVASLLLWSALSDKRTGLSLTTAAGPRQRRHCRVRVSWDSRPYFTVSDSRYSNPPPDGIRKPPISSSWRQSP
jgi:hypothetical protein